MIKNWKSQRWQTLLNFNSKRRLLITGQFPSSRTIIVDMHVDVLLHVEHYILPVACLL